MGIPHLITHLRPFATAEDLSGQIVVIDGPGLAYHIYHLILASQPRIRNPFEAVPSSVVIGNTVLRWLDEFRSNNVILAKIYFDGFLPSSKRETRSSRLSSYTKQLSEYYQAWPQIFPVLDKATPRSSQFAVGLFSVEPGSSSYTKLPATPFLVPTILEALLGCEVYRKITEVVPGEADMYCARYVRIHGGTVFTGDSDLLVHDLGKGSVTFLKDIELVETDTGKSFKCIQYNVAAIAERLGLPSFHGIKSLAFEMTMDYHGSFRRLLQQATQSKAILLHEKSFGDFSREYAPLPENILADKLSLPDEEADLSLLSQRLKMLDPRISEYVLQFPMFAQAAGLSKNLIPSTKQEIDMFLPFLLDCPVRTSGWETSISIRQLAYSLVNLVLPEEDRITTVMEHRRQQNGTRGREWQLPSKNELLEACMGFTDLIFQYRKLLPSTAESQIWRALAFHHQAVFAPRRDRTSMGSSSMVRFGESSKPTPFRFTWDGIHSFAQLEGSYYSFRILSQILDVVFSCRVEGLPAILSSLQKELQTLPSLKDMESPADGIRLLGGSEDKAIWAAVHKLLNTEENPQARIALSTKKQKKKRKMKASADDSSSKKKVTNMFEFLASE